MRKFVELEKLPGKLKITLTPEGREMLMEELIPQESTIAGFSGDPKLSNEGKLEAIQMAWLEEHNDRKA